MSNTAAGYVYVSTLNDHYDQMRQNSIKSLRSVDPDAVVCTAPSLQPGYATRALKTRLPFFTPFAITCYVDTDTFFNRRPVLDRELEHADIAAALDPHPTLAAAAAVTWSPEHVSVKEVRHTLAVCGPDFPFFNGGVLMFRQCDKIREFFSVWLDEWQTYGQCDQFALARALVLTAVRPAVLSSLTVGCVLGSKLPLVAPDIVHYIEGDKVALMRAHGNWAL